MGLISTLIFNFNWNNSMTDLSTSLVSDSARLIRVLTDEFKLSMHDVRQAHRDVMWGSQVSEEFLHSLGYAVVHSRPPVGEGDFVEVLPTLEDGLFYQNWQKREPAPGEALFKVENAKAIAEATVKSFSASSVERGAAFNFGTEDEPRILSMQIRDQDRLNVLGMETMAKRRPEMQQYFRTAENIMVKVTAEQLYEMNNLAYTAYVAIKSAEWALLDSIRSATTVEEIPALPESLRQFYETNAGLTWVEQTA